MKIKDLLGSITDVDVYDDYAEDLSIAYCGETLTDKGKEKFAEVIELDCTVSGDIVTIEINKLTDGEDERLLALACEMFEGMAGYIDASLYDEYFVETKI